MGLSLHSPDSLPCSPAGHKDSWQCSTEDGTHHHLPPGSTYLASCGVCGGDMGGKLIGRWCDGEGVMVACARIGACNNVRKCSVCGTRKKYSVPGASFMRCEVCYTVRESHYTSKKGTCGKGMSMNSVECKSRPSYLRFWAGRGVHRRVTVIAVIETGGGVTLHIAMAVVKLQWAVIRVVTVSPRVWSPW